MNLAAAQTLPERIAAELRPYCSQLEIAGSTRPSSPRMPASDERAIASSGFVDRSMPR
jgi:hypothetical protein